jgi:hypothetical protein
MCHRIIGFGLIEIQSQHDQNSGTLYIVDGVLIKNGCLYYTSRHHINFNFVHLKNISLPYDDIT